MYGPMDAIAAWTAHLVWEWRFGRQCGVSMLMAAVGVYLMAELVFWAYMKLWLAKRLEMPTSPPTHHRTSQEVIDLVMDTAECIEGIYEPDEFISKWFRGVPAEQVKQGNVLDLLAWAAYHRKFEELKPDEAALVTEQQFALAKRFDVNFPEGKTPNLEPCWMTLEKLNFHHRPLFGWYLGLWWLQVVAYVFFRYHGFRRMAHGRLVYWIRRVEGEEDQSKAPLLFFHGISPGLFVYSMLALPFARGRTSILFESPHINLSLGCLRPPSRLETLRDVGEICAKHGITRCVAMGHSFGSIKAGWLASSRPDLVAQLILLDPVSILLMLPDVCYNFIYRQPNTWLEHAIHYLASKELTIVNALKRHFWWFENVLLLVDVKCPMVVLLGEKDEVLPARAVCEYLRRVVKAGERPEIDILWMKGFSHAQCLFSRRAIEEVLLHAELQESKYCKSKAPTTVDPSAPSLPLRSSSNQIHDVTEAGVVAAS